MDDLSCWDEQLGAGHVALCGTTAGYAQHKTSGEQPCEECREARRAYMRQYRERRGRNMSEAEKARARERAGKWSRENRERKNAYQRERYAADPEKARAYSRKYLAKITPEQRRAIWIKSKYRLTDEQYADLLTHPNSCAACSASFEEDGVRRHIDHDHSTGAFRGLLCGACNQAAGLLRDQATRADQLAAYLRRVTGQD